jgi:hypothetical protein
LKKQLKTYKVLINSISLGLEFKNFIIFKSNYKNYCCANSDLKIVSNHNRSKMSHEIILSLNGLEQTLQVISGKFKNWKVWKIKFKNGEEAVLFKHMDEWMQRHEDRLDHKTITAIGKQIDLINNDISFA